MTKHPMTSEVRSAMWIDDYFGRHQYGVRFGGEDTVYRGDECEQVPEPMEPPASEIAQ